MVGVVVRRQHPGDPHAVGRRGVEQVVDRVRRIDEQALAGRPVADQVGEVDHLRGERVADREVAAGEQLAEVEPSIVAAVVVAAVGVVPSLCPPSFEAHRA